jgi:hypothetical protein
VPCSWLLGLARAISRWRAALPRDHSGIIVRHRGAIGDAEFVTYLPPIDFGPADPRLHLPDELQQRVRHELVRLRDEIETGTPWRSLLAAIRLGAVIHARLQSDAPAVLIMEPRPVPHSQAWRRFHRVRHLTGVSASWIMGTWRGRPVARLR